MKNETLQAKSLPTKQFFVSMLTRDISISDSILDLIDNCLDGAMRSSKSKTDYSKFEINVKFSDSHFSITDNCGGIPIEIAKNYAFKMGRERTDERDNRNETIGMYGIGMKRAIFKMGEEAEVLTKNVKDYYKVEIKPKWLNSEEWTGLPLIKLNETSYKEKDDGTTITVTKLYKGVAKHFSNKAFLNELTNSISEHFTVFLNKGLKIKINDVQVNPKFVELLVAKSPKGPKPYVYEKTVNNVTFSIVVGLNTGRNTTDEEDFEEDRESATSGWSVFCNDRAIIVGDKTRLTGWGDGIPHYHPQFSVITGIIEFRSNSAEQLPVTTTKRALDASSEIWLEARTKMRDGLRLFISHTNKWKNHPKSDQSEYWKDAKSVNLKDAIDIVKSQAKLKNGILEYNPVKENVLPLPKDDKPTLKRIIYSKSISEINLVSQYFYGNIIKSPGEVGEKCFDIILKKAKAN